MAKHGTKTCDYAESAHKSCHLGEGGQGGDFRTWGGEES